MGQDNQHLRFFNPSLGTLNFTQVVGEVLKYIADDPEKNYEIILGCDSSSEERPVFPVALVVLRKGEGGRFFLAKIRYPSEDSKRFSSLHQRILQEVYISCDLALEFKQALKKEAAALRKPVEYQFQYIHADIGENGQTRDMIKEVVGYIRGNGFEAKIKPESFAASIVADRFT